MNKKISDPKVLLKYIEEQYDRWYVTNKKTQREIVETNVYNYINNIMDGSIYIEACDGRASGLCSYPYFERDILKLIGILKSKIEENNK